MIPLPDPPLVGPIAGELGCEGGGERTRSHPGRRDLDLLLRPWGLEDAPALVEAWADPDIERWTGVPSVRDLAAAERWIAGADVRRARWLSLDLVVDRDGIVAGEVGLSSFDRDAATAEIGWWTAAAHRGRGVASTAAGLLARWARAELGLVSVVARCDVRNPASVAVARRAGAMVLV